MQESRDAANSEGRYRLGNLPAGTYYIVASPPGTLGKRDGPVMTYYPGTVHIETAVPVEIAAGMDLPHMDVKLAGTPTVCVRLRATFPMDSVYLALSVRHPLAPDGYSPAIPLGGPGRFEACGLIPGPYYAVAYNRAGYNSRQPIEIDETGEQEFTLQFPPQAAVTGRIVFEGEAPARLPAMRVDLHPVERGTAGLPQAPVEESRAFTLQRVNPGRYLASLSDTPDGFYVKSIRAGTADVLGKPLEVAGSGPGALEFVLSPNVGSVRGTVQDDKGQGPAPGAIVLLLPEEPERQGLEMYLAFDVAGSPFRMSPRGDTESWPCSRLPTPVLSGTPSFWRHCARKAIPWTCARNPWRRRI